MDASGWTSVPVRADTHQAGKDFSSVIHRDSFALWGIVVKKPKQFLGFEEAQ